MILKGTAIDNRTQAVNLAKHLLKANDNEVCEVVDIDGHARPDDLRAALEDMYDMVGLTNGKTGLFMVSINPEAAEVMQEGDYERSIKRLEETFKLEGLPKAVVRHYKEGREHYHVVWQTTNTDSQKIQAELYRYKVKCKNVARELELEFGHKQVSNEKSGNAYDEKERAQAKTSSRVLKPDDRKKLVQELYGKAKDSAQFEQSIRDEGYKLAKGKVGYCLVDAESGQVYNLEKELGKKVKQEHLEVFFENHETHIVEASKLSRQIQSEAKKADREKKKDADKGKSGEADNKEAKYRIVEGEAQELPKPANEKMDNLSQDKAQAFAENRDDYIKEEEKESLPPASDQKQASEQKAKEFGANRDNATNELTAAEKKAAEKEAFKQKLREAMGNMQKDQANDKSDDLTQERKSLWDRFKDNGLELVFLPFVKSVIQWLLQ